MKINKKYALVFLLHNMLENQLQEYGWEKLRAEGIYIINFGFGSNLTVPIRDGLKFFIQDRMRKPSEP